MTNNFAIINEMSKLVLTPVTIRRIFLLLTRLHYSDNANYGKFKEVFANFIWHKDEKLRKLQIDYDYHYDPKNLDRRPAIFVGLDDIRFNKVVIGNRSGDSEDRSGEEFTKTASTNVIIRHIGKTADEAPALADLSSQFFMGITPMIHDSLRGKILEYDVIGLKSSRPFERSSEQADQNFCSDLIIALSYNSIWMTSFESHRIKTISFQTSLAELSA
jgi:hypothetical protein